MNKKIIKEKAKAKDRAHNMGSFVFVKYYDSIYQTSLCKICGSKVLIKDGKVEYGSALEFDCKGE